MKKTKNIVLVIGVILIIMILMPSMVGRAQNFWNNDNSKEVDLITNNNDDKEQPNGDREELLENKEEEIIGEIIEGNKDDKENKDEKDENTKVNIVKADPNKKVFFTFDDGPSTLTPNILQILKENNIKATFFTIGTSVERHPEIVRQAYEEGHMVLPHSYTHDYSVYTTFETYYKDLELAKKSIEDVLDLEVPYIFRFPGGSSNHSSFKYGGEQYMPNLTKDVKEKGYYYIDWNVSSGDASKDYDKKDKIISNVVDYSEGKDFIVVLFHDTGRNTTMAEVLPEIIDKLKEKSYTFRSFKDITQDELDTMVKLKLANKPIVR